MDRFLNVEEIEDLLKSKKKHDVGRINDILPFLSKRTQAIKGNFNNVLGEYVRIICGFKLNTKKIKTKDELFFSEYPLVEQMIYEVECSDDDKFDLKLFLEQYLYNQEKGIKPTHPYLYNYVEMPQTNNNKKHERELNKYAQFIYDTTVIDEKSVSEIFNHQMSDDILSELILSKLDALEPRHTNSQFQPLLTTLSERYQEDLIYLSKYKEYFLHSFPLLTHFYTFMYICQLFLKFEEFDNADYTELSPLYFALEWESLSGRRESAGIRGFRPIKERSKNLFVHIHTISQLSHNRLNDGGRFMNYSELMRYVDKDDSDSAEVFFKDLKEWITKYREWIGIEHKEEPESLSEAFKVLFKSLQEGMSTAVCEKYGKNLEDLGATILLKNRGSLGQVLNMNHEMLLLLTAVCVKNERIPLNKLFNEYEKRGVTFDRYSKKEIIDLFDSLNIIDKKSDSGDAQYVKPIL